MSRSCSCSQYESFILGGNKPQNWGGKVLPPEPARGQVRRRHGNLLRKTDGTGSGTGKR